MMIWNEMEVVDVRRFRQRDMMAFAEAVEETHHIYDRRWPRASRFGVYASLNVSTVL